MIPNLPHCKKIINYPANLQKCYNFSPLLDGSMEPSNVRWFPNQWSPNSVKRFHMLWELK